MSVSDDYAEARELVDDLMVREMQIHPRLVERLLQLFSAMRERRPTEDPHRVLAVAALHLANEAYGGLR